MPSYTKRVDPSPRRRIGGYAEYAPSADLADCVEAFWTYRTNDSTEAPHRVLPHTGVTLVFQHWVDGVRDDVSVFLYGPVRNVRMFAAPEALALDAVQLRPEWSRGILGIAPEDHVDRLDDWAEVSRSQTGDLLQGFEATMRLGGSGLDVLTSWIRARRVRERIDPAERLARAALRHMRSVGARTKLQDTAVQLGMSAKSVRRIVMSVAGDRPKTLQRIDRLNRTVAEADAVRSPRWSELAVKHGYFDQAHLIHEFRALTGATPIQVDAGRRAQRVPFFQSDRPPNT